MSQEKELRGIRTPRKPGQGKPQNPQPHQHPSPPKQPHRQKGEQS